MGSAYTQAAPKGPTGWSTCTCPYAVVDLLGTQHAYAIMLWPSQLPDSAHTSPTVFWQLLKCATGSARCQVPTSSCQPQSAQPRAGCLWHLLTASTMAQAAGSMACHRVVGAPGDQNTSRTCTLCWWVHCPALLQACGTESARLLDSEPSPPPPPPARPPNLQCTHHSLCLLQVAVCSPELQTLRPVLLLQVHEHALLQLVLPANTSGRLLSMCCPDTSRWSGHRA